MTDDYDLRTLRTEQLARELEQQFVEYVLDEATDRAHDGPLSVDAVVNAFQQLERYGHRIHDDEWNAQVMGFVGPEAYHDLSDDAARVSHLPPEPPTNTVMVHDVPIRVAPVLPDKTCLLIHHDAVIPSSTLSMKRPWLVRHPSGVVAIRTTGE